ncbi:RluA family pseudouridine synthase [Bdellovibrionota bacterium FG-1]
MTSTWSWAADDQASALRADLAILKALEQRLGAWSGPEIYPSRNQLQRLMNEEQVFADGTPIKAKVKLLAGTLIQVHFPEPRPVGLIPEARPLDILFQDAHIVVLNKPPGLTVHPSETQNEGTLVHALLFHIKDLSGIGGEMRPGIVHRIDKNTSGALVITKTDTAHRALAETFARHDIERVYWAYCFGSPTTGAGRIENLIGRNPHDRKKMAITVSEGRRAVTHYRRIEEYGLPKFQPFASWLEARLETGRTHQVRVHLTGLGHSLLGDPTYGVPTEKHPKWLAMPPLIREKVLKLPGQALHARVLGFTHPITGEKLRFEAEPPAALQALMDALKPYA